MIIFEKVLESIRHDYNRQRRQYRLGLVCWPWYAARVKRNEYFVEGRTCASKLLKTFKVDPTRASHATLLDFNSAGGKTVARILALCTSLTEPRIHNENALPVDALASLTPTVRKLHLNINGTGRRA